MLIRRLHTRGVIVQWLQYKAKTDRFGFYYWMSSPYPKGQVRWNDLIKYKKMNVKDI